ncbi:MAG: aspartate aminotransferase family protein [Oscillospiraceae bacterium]|nr:aspartate aminotransferase family protein [Oscillospiraceae bacterium]
MNTKEFDSKYIAGTYARFPINLVSGKGSLLYDNEGKEYIDLMSGIAVNTFGTADEEWVLAVTEQLNRLQHTSNLFYSDPAPRLASLLCEKTGMKKVFFSNSGAEANECAIKAARKYAALKKGKDCYKIITLENSFHGRTITTLAATGQEVFHKDFLPLTEGFIYAKANDIEDLKQKASGEDIAAIMFEVVQGEGGVMPLNPQFVSAIAEISKEKDILLIADEVQIGNGRSGKLYGYMNYDITPDIVTTAKGLGGGLPIGATLFAEKVESVFSFGDHGSTFGGNPIAAAGAISIMERLDDELLKSVSEKSDYIISALSGKKGIKSVSGMGLMLGIETEKDASLVIKQCHEKGVLVIKAKNKVRLLPPLNIPMELLKKAVDIIISACEG